MKASDEQIVEALVESSVEDDIDSLKVPVRITVGKKALAEHQRIINRLGIYGAVDLTPIELEKYLQENQYSVYPLESVNKYMNKKVAEMGEKKKPRRSSWSNEIITNKWRWVPLRMAQATKDRLFCKQVVPVEVLMTVEKIYNDLGDQVMFEVTEIYRSVRQQSNPAARTPFHGDPFLCVKAGTSRYVLERWDEPGFRA